MASLLGAPWSSPVRFSSSVAQLLFSERGFFKSFASYFTSLPSTLWLPASSLSVVRSFIGAHPFPFGCSEFALSAVNGSESGIGFPPGHDVSKCKAKRIFRPSGSLLPNPLPSKSGKDYEDLSKKSDYSNGLQQGILETSCSAIPLAPLIGDVEVNPYSSPENVDHARLEVLGFDGVLVHSTDVENLEARKLGNPSQYIGPTEQLAPVSDTAFTEVITKCPTTLPQADSSFYMENVDIDMGPDINSEHWCIGPQLQSMPVNSQQILDKLRKEPVAPESMEPILIDAEIRWNPRTVASMGRSDDPEDVADAISSDSVPYAQETMPVSLQLGSSLQNHPPRNGPSIGKLRKNIAELGKQFVVSRPCAIEESPNPGFSNVGFVKNSKSRRRRKSPLIAMGTDC
ncbi:hypothetical protein Nepgr_030911 [Nepenthes gracilis]|uniref:Uncharacterized protein n=1 Tax=Nepenthes gracilis TaxID=150966 RepID=A0AAD3Y4P3_NEPGR|nr:hypothetical protein Nepgr_030911 [Nepenthes gracilis]